MGSLLNIHPFIHPLIHSFVHSFIHSFIQVSVNPDFYVFKPSRNEKNGNTAAVDGKP